MPSDASDETRTYDDVILDLRHSYDRHAAERDQHQIEPWKQDQRQKFLDRLVERNVQSLLEIGAGNGRDALFFQQHGIDVTCVDLSPAMVASCQEKGLRAYVRDFLALDFPPASFDAVYALNCLLHVPNRDLAAVLASIQSVLKPGGLFFLGVYAGHGFEGVWDQDTYEPKRFFSFRTDETLRAAVAGYFEIRSFERISADDTRGLYVQALTLAH
jgi:SAM-dependent methyltransferase